MSHPEAGGERGGSGSAGQLCPCSLHPSVPLHATPQPRQPPSLGPGAGIAPQPRLPSPLLRGRGSHGEAEGLPTSGFSHSFPITSSPAPTSAVHRRCSLGSRPRGLCLGGNSIQMELFFHIFGGEGRKVWEKSCWDQESRGKERI